MPRSASSVDGPPNRWSPTSATSCIRTSRRPRPRLGQRQRQRRRHRDRCRRRALACPSSPLACHHPGRCRACETQPAPKDLSGRGCDVRNRSRVRARSTVRRARPCRLMDTYRPGRQPGSHDERSGGAPRYGRAAPVSRRVFRLESTAGQPCEIACRTLLAGKKPSWMTVSFTTPCPTPSMSKATFERGSARQS